MRFSPAICFLAILLAAATGSAQNWPGRISGYKLYDPKITVTGKSADGVEVKVTRAELTRIGLTGTTLEIKAELTSRKQGAEVDFVRFRDILVNGVAVEPEEYRTAFSLKKGTALKLPAPFVVRVPITSHPKAVYDQLRNPKTRLKITGTVFIFGKFKKLGIVFKRVAPVKLDLEIDNPLKLT